MKKILFLTTSNLTSNPRLFKELLVANERNSCSFVGFQLGNWSEPLEAKNQAALKGVDFQYLSATRRPFFPWMMATIVQRISRYIALIWRGSMLFNAMAVDKRSWLLWQHLKHDLKTIPDLIVAHTPGTLFPAWWLSRKMKVPFIFDVEDFHPGEGVKREDYNPESNPIAMVMQKLLPQARRVTFSSAQIMKETLKIVPDIKKAEVITNCFSEKEFIAPKSVNQKKNKISLVWYSQNINHSRGLEPFIKVLNSFSTDYHLTLIGNLNQPFAKKWIEPYRNFIETIKPMPQKELHHSLANYDVGLALEPGKDLNNELALSNKIWAYLQAGLYIISTNTPAQSDFIGRYSAHGILTAIDPEAIANTLETVKEQREEILKFNHLRFIAAKKFSWEQESRKIRFEDE